MSLKTRNLVDIRRKITLRDLQDQERVCAYMCMCAKDDVSMEFHIAEECIGHTLAKPRNGREEVEEESLRGNFSNTLRALKPRVEGSNQS